MEIGNPYPCPKCGRPGGAVTIDKKNTLCESCEIIHVLSVRPKPKPCHWCGKDTECRIRGSCPCGWIAFVECIDIFCGARGPYVQTKTMSNDEHETKNEAIRKWNMVGSPLVEAVSKNNSKNKIKCLRCKGTGKIKAMSFEKCGEHIENSCNTCQGNGWIKP